ncbi:PREDICTED: protein CHUP1, chloroplastic-like isoform X2 [Tarenaya hassleriana]|uniref:protein CHUP1, chloroplastic-like isoform X2 n=1 Tax=Tarenaya hassleriana TaxID=28532 RepID=UPI00053C23DC|nr:PREDICTED: protein CHUP1, chloroplastic-like isoform X2 [Tarenaya hassleriana]
MVAGKVRVTMGFHKSPSNKRKQQQQQSDMTPPPPPPPPPSSAAGKPTNPGSNQKAIFSRSFGVYFPRASAQVHAATRSYQPDHSVSELRRQVEELREREVFLQTELLELKLLRESVSVIPILKSQISEKIAEIESARKATARLEEENSKLRREIEESNARSEEQRRESERREKEMEMEIGELRKIMMARESEEHPLSASQRFQGLVDASAKSNFMKSLKRVGSWRNTPDPNPDDNNKPNSTGDGSFYMKDETESRRPSHSEDLNESDSLLSDVKARVPRVPKPPPKRSLSYDGRDDSTENRAAPVRQKTAPAPPPPPPPPATVSKHHPPPPPPPPPKSLYTVAAEKVRRVPEVVEFYHSLMRRDSASSRRDSTGSNGAGGTEALPATAAANARDMIGEIENRSAYLLAIKTDVETQGDFIRFLIKEVENAAFSDIEDVVPFVKWLDDELSYLVDERAVLKQFDWPEQKADALREAAFSYFDLKKLESEASRFRDDPRQPSAPALKKMQSLFENLSRMRESAAAKYKTFQIPVDWMLETGITSQIKLASVKLAKNYMKRVSAELEAVDEEELIVQGVRFAFRVHQFAGGFDVETMRAFQELRDKARSCNNHTSHQA